MNQSNSQNLTALADTIQLYNTQTSSGHCLTQSNKVESLYHDMIDWLEAFIWSVEPADRTCHIELFESLHREYQAQYAGQVFQYRFIVVIPVADRPVHLQNCCQSLLELCETYEYGGQVRGMYPAVQVIVADDSRLDQSKQAHQALVSRFNEQGLNIEYFGQAEQLDTLRKFNEKGSLHFAVGSHDADRFYHKGASVTRNLVYMKLRSAGLSEDEYLLHFIDSDQTFNVDYQVDGHRPEQFKLNYFYALNKVFQHSSIKVATGKVVGDPPVSPAVMTSKMLDDLLAFLTVCQTHSPEDKCCFHQRHELQDIGAAYHDMSQLFDFESTKQTYSYPCAIHSDHNLVDTLVDFSSRLRGFFHGAHPTRKNNYVYSELLSTLNPARTIYTGNYIIRPEMLAYYIPFADMKLRMAGPTLGRIFKARLGESFVSVNLPMMHKRTVSDEALSEYRSGVEDQGERVDLGGEFERQYYGDVMLFSVKALCDANQLDKLTSERVKSLVIQVEEDIHRQYFSMQDAINKKHKAIKNMIQNEMPWDRVAAYSEKATMAKSYLNHFLNNVELNFSPEAEVFKRLSDPVLRAEKTTEIINSLLEYDANQKHWVSLV